MSPSLVLDVGREFRLNSKVFKRVRKQKVNLGLAQWCAWTNKNILTHLFAHRIPKIRKPEQRSWLRVNITKMYGLLLDSLKSYVVTEFSEVCWRKIVVQADSETFDFEPRRDYDEQLFPRLLRETMKVTRSTEEQIKYGMGKSFKKMGVYKDYQVILSVLGRNMREFLNGLDNFHEFLRAVYPQMRIPSFFCLNESRSGITLQYVTKRPGFVPFFIGWMEYISMTFFELKICITVSNEFGFIYYTFDCFNKLTLGQFPLYCHVTLVCSETWPSDRWFNTISTFFYSWQSVIDCFQLYTIRTFFSLESQNTVAGNPEVIRTNATE